MKVPSLLRATALALALVTLGACATSSAGTAETAMTAPAEGTDIVVDARTSPVSSMTVWLHPDTGARERLGVVTSDELRRFPVDDVLYGSDVHLVAETTMGNEVVSREFTLLDNSLVEWDVDLNTITIREGAAD